MHSQDTHQESKIYHPKLTKKNKFKRNSSNLTFFITDSNKINQITLKILC